MVDDVLAASGSLFLGSRIKRLADRMQADATLVLEDLDLPVQPSHIPLLAALDRHGMLTVSDAVEALGISQPAVTRISGFLAQLGLIEASRPASDGRQKCLALTAAGRALVERIRIGLWPQVRSAADALCDGLSGSFLDQIAGLEERLGQRPLAARIADAAARLAEPVPPLAIRAYTDALAPDFYAINAEWIEAMFRLEDEDRRILSDPRGVIVEPGGVVLFVEAPDLGIVGAGALMKVADGVYELTKMGVAPRAQGRGAGEALLRALVARAEAIGVEELYLLTHPKCAAAIRLYEKVGFVHDPALLAVRGGKYTRATVAMRYPVAGRSGPVRIARGPADMAAVATLFRDYAASLDVDLALQGFEAELAALPGAYASPSGALLLAFDAKGEAVGCVGLRPFEGNEVCELKRLFVREDARGTGLGRHLLEAAIDAAKAAGYRTMVLDTLMSLTGAIGLYRRFGFEETPPYWRNPFPDVLYWRLDLRAPRQPVAYSPKVSSKA